jgi:hypothetical protein
VLNDRSASLERGHYDDIGCGGVCSQLMVVCGGVFLCTSSAQSRGGGVGERGREVRERLERFSPSNPRQYCWASPGNRQCGRAAVDAFFSFLCIVRYLVRYFLPASR